MKRFYLLLLGLFVVLGYSNTALAFDLFKPSDNDWLVKNIMETLFNPENSPFGAISEVFLSGVLAFGGVLAGYTLLVGTMSTAHDGEMLGKRWSTMWVPIRTTLGVAMILPIKNGFCAIQIVVVWLATQGIGLADQTWDAFVDQPLLGTSNYAGPVLTPGLKTAFVNAASMTACVKAVSDYEQKLKGESSNNSIFAGKPINFNIYPLKGGITGYQYGSQDNRAYTGFCGSIQLDRKPDSTQNNWFGADAPKAAYILMNTEATRNLLYVNQQRAFDALVQAANQTGLAVANDPNYSEASIQSEMDTAVNAFITTVQEQAKSSYSEMVNSDVKQSMKDDGFASAGSWFLKIIKAQDLVNYEINNLPQSSPITAGTNQYDFSNYNQIGTSAFTLAYNKLNGVSQSSNKGLKNTEIVESDDSFFSSFIKKLTTSGSLFSSAQLVNPTEHPIVLAMSIGNQMVLGLVTAITAIAVATASGGWIPFVGDSIVSVASLLGPFISAIALSILLPALYLSVYVPLMPFIIWTGTILGWLILVVEALFAAPLWAMAHLAPDGDGVVGKQGQGYMIILSLILRPVLMVIGFVVSISLMVPAGQFINYFFAFAVAGSGSNIVIQGVISLGSCFVYCVIIHNLMKKMLGLIHGLPDSILQWIGGHSSQLLGDYSRGLENESGGAANAAINQSIAGGRDGIRSLKDKFAQNKQGKSNAAREDQQREMESSRHSQMLGAIRGDSPDAGGGVGGDKK